MIKVKMQNRLKQEFLMKIKVWCVLREVAKKLQTVVARKHKRAIWAVFSMRMTQRQIMKL